MKVLAIIPARGGSKGIPRKNIRLLAGKPLIAHTIAQARQAHNIGRVVVSTDDNNIADVARQYGAEVIRRPSEISGDTATSESALLHALDYLRDTEGYEPDLVVFLQCTSPLRQPGDIDAAIQALVDEQADSLLSVTQFLGFIWRWQDGIAQSFNYDARARPRRQDRQPEYLENGSIYVFKPWVLRHLHNRLGGKTTLYMMHEQSQIDIDTPHDFALCEWLLTQNETTDQEQTRRRDS
jgi:N-acylneuraminate cytidylyltransferase